MVKGLESWDVGMLEGSKRCDLSAFLASKLPGLKPFAVVYRL
jgi:hypothetical protein